MEGVIKGEGGQEWLNGREHGWYKKDLELCNIKLNPPFWRVLPNIVFWHAISSNLEGFWCLFTFILTPTC